MIIYTDMVADLYHYGHAKYIENIYNSLVKNTNNLLYVGIHNDIDVQIYKRKPILTMDERIRVLESNKYINKIIANAPVIINKEYALEHKIDVLCIPNNRTLEEINSWYKTLINMGTKVEKFQYTTEISTSDIIKKIKNRKDL